MAKYDEIGVDYDETRRPDPYILQRIYHHLGFSEEGRYLDIACGTGNYTLALSSMGNARFFGIVISERMIGAAREKGQSVLWCRGDVELLPFKSGIFAGAICTLAIHHFSRLFPVFREAFRVLARGRLVILIATPEQMENYWLNRYFPRAMALSIEKMPPLEKVVDNLKISGYENIQTEMYDAHDDLQDLFLYSGKHNPELYLDPNIRRGISTFSSLADFDEVEEGSRRLADDIRIGKIDEVIKSYTGYSGDYIFITADKV